MRCPSCSATEGVVRMGAASQTGRT
ncbi:TPA: hypothetical protein ACF3L6_003962 [Shigella sonnei]